MKKYLLLLIVSLAMHSETWSQKNWSIDGMVFFNLDRFGNPRYDSDAWTNVASYTSPSLRVAKRLNKRWEIFAGIQYFRKTDYSRSVINPSFLFPESEVFYAIYYFTNKHHFRGVTLSLGGRYHFVSKRNWELYGIAAIVDRMVRYSEYMGYNMNTSMAVKSKGHNGSIGMETGIGTHFRLNNSLGIRAELTIKPLEYQNEPALPERNGIKGLSHAALGLGLSYSL